METRVIRKILGVFSILVGFTIIGIWILLFSLHLVSDLQMSQQTLISHLFAEGITSVINIIAGILLFLDKESGKYVFFLGLGFILYAILNVIGHYIFVDFIWLVGVLIIALIITTGIALFTLIKREILV